MRNILFLTGALLISVVSFSQSDVRANRIIADQSLMPPVRDTVDAPGRVGEMRFRISDSSLYTAVAMTAGVKRWEKLAKTSDLSSAVAGYAWGLAGNGATVDGTNFVGTINNVPLSFRVNNQKAGRINSSGQTVLGYQAGNVNTASNITAFGYQVLKANTTGNYNVGFGQGALLALTTGDYNTGIGNSALASIISGTRNTAVGFSTLVSSTTDDNTAIGHLALAFSTSGAKNTAIGSQALQTNSTSSDNVAVGYKALFSQTTAAGIGFNTAVGSESQELVTIGHSNTSLGARSLLYNIAGSINTAIGTNALLNNQGDKNTAVGAGALESNSIGTHNTAVGFDALLENTEGHWNIGVGWNALKNNHVGDLNIAIGYSAGSTTEDGDRNIFIGYQAGLNASQKVIPINSVAIGNDSYTTKDSQFVVGSTNIKELKLYSSDSLMAPGMKRSTSTSWVAAVDSATKNITYIPVSELVTTPYTDEQAQDAVGAMIDGSLNYVDGTPLLQRAALTGDVTASAGSNTTTLATVNANVGTFNNVTVNAKGLVTAASNVAYLTSETDPTAVHLTGNETVAGIKTFTSNPVVSATAAATGNIKFTDAGTTFWEVGKGSSQFQINRLNTSGVHQAEALKIAQSNGQWTINVGTDASPHYIFMTSGLGIQVDDYAGTGTRVATLNSLGLFTPLANGTNGHVLTLTAGAPSWSAPAANSWNGIYAISSEIPNTTLTMTNTTTWSVFTGSGTGVWTLPALSANLARALFVKNATAFNLTVQRAGSDQIYENGAVTSVVLAPGESRQFTGNTSYWYSNSDGKPDAGGYTDEQAQDAVGAMINASLQYIDGTPLLAINDRDNGDITTSGSGLTWTIDNDVVTYAKMQNVSATARVLGRITSGAGDAEELTGTQVTSLLDEATFTQEGIVNTVSQNFLGNKTIKGESNSTGAALTVLNSDGLAVAQFNNDGDVGLGGSTIIPGFDLTLSNNLAIGNHIRFAEQAAPSTPASGTAIVYVKSDGLFYGKDDAGVETALSNGAGSGQPNIQFQDEGSNEGTSGGVTTVDFVGAGVSANESGGVLTVTIPGGGASALDDLTDVVITAPATGEFIRYNGSNWVDATIQAGDVPDISSTYVPVAGTSSVTGKKSFTGGIATTSYQAITSGSSGTVSDNITTVRFDPGSVLGSYTLTMPATPVDGQWVDIYFGGTVAAGAGVVTSLTISPNAGHTLYQPITPTQGNGGDHIAYQFISSTNQWIRKK